MKNRYIALGLVTLILSGYAQSEMMTSIPGNGETQLTRVRYLCDNKDVHSVAYLNNEPNSIAVFEMLDKQKLIMVNVVAASGEKYVGGIYEWWTKGDSGTLTNLMNDKTTHCQALK